MAATILAGCSSAPKLSGTGSAGLFSSNASFSGPEALARFRPACEAGQASACALIGNRAESKHELSILQSITSETQTRFVIVRPKRETLTYIVRDAVTGALTHLAADTFTRAHSDTVVDQVEAFRLAPNVRYQLLVLTRDGDLRDTRDFQTLNLAQSRARVAVVSCMDDHMAEVASRMWPQLLSARPDALLLIGDNVYADHGKNGWEKPTAEGLWDRYVETRQDLPLFFAERLVPTFAIWDDHDFGTNDSDRTWPLKDASLEVFMTFFAQRRAAPGFERGPGVAGWWTAFGAHFALLDDRYFRSPNRVDLPDQTHLGSEQESWLLTHLKATVRPVFLVEGDQFFGGYHQFESFEGSHPKNFAAQLKAWRIAKGPLVFVSGDRHLSEIMRVPEQVLGYPTYEFTSSGIHSTVFAEAFKNSPSPNQLVGAAGKYNYTILELMRSERSRVQFAVQAFGDHDTLLYQKTLTVKHP